MFSLSKREQYVNFFYKYITCSSDTVTRQNYCSIVCFCVICTSGVASHDIPSTLPVYASLDTPIIGSDILDLMCTAWQS